MGSSTTITLLAPAATQSCAMPSMPDPASRQVTGPPRRVPAAINSAVTELSLLSSVPSPKTSTPLAMLVLPQLVPVRPLAAAGFKPPPTQAQLLYQLRLAQALGQLYGLLLRAVAVDELGLDRGVRHEERLQRHAVGGCGDAQVGQAPGLNFLLGGHHDLAELRVSRLAQLVADGDHGRRRRLHGLEPVQQHALD